MRGYLVPLLMVGALSGCSHATSGSSGCSVTVAVASSLTTALKAYEPRVEEASGCDVNVVSGSSAVLAAQIDAGAPMDVFLSASREMVIQAGLNGADAIDLVSTRGAIWVSKFAANQIRSLDDLLGADELKIGLCVSAAPCGTLADRILANAGRSRADIVDTESTNADDLLLKVGFGEIDGAIGFANACVSSKRIVCVEIPQSRNGMPINASTQYVLISVEESAEVQAVAEELASEEFIRTLVDTFGFERP